MKLYGKPCEGHSSLIGYRCEDCQTEVRGEDLPKNWIDVQGEHYCPDCQVECFTCHRKFDLAYLEYYMTEGMCEDCYDKFLEGGENDYSISWNLIL